VSGSHESDIGPLLSSIGAAQLEPASFDDTNPTCSSQVASVQPVEEK
jgi:hypothetical protein